MTLKKDIKENDIKPNDIKKNDKKTTGISQYENEKELHTAEWHSS
jgi:hypothetical protein